MWTIIQARNKALWPQVHLDPHWKLCDSEKCPSCLHVCRFIEPLKFLSSNSSAARLAISRSFLGDRFVKRSHAQWFLGWTFVVKVNAVNVNGDKRRFFFLRVASSCIWRVERGRARQLAQTRSRLLSSRKRASEQHSDLGAPDDDSIRIFSYSADPSQRTSLVWIRLVLIKEGCLEFWERVWKL